MGISCSCDYEEDGMTAVGDPAFMTCRTPRKCDECGNDIDAGDGLYRYNMYDFGDYSTAPPHWMCESCGDLILSILEQGFCFYLGDIKGQWRDYVADL